MLVVSDYQVYIVVEGNVSMFHPRRPGEVTNQQKMVNQNEGGGKWRYNIQVVRVYGSTISYNPEETEEFYIDKTQTWSNKNSTFKFLVGDFNAR